MTNANGFFGKRKRGFMGIFSSDQHSARVKYEPVNNIPVSRVSVGFETGARYVRHVNENKSKSNAVIAHGGAKVAKKAYIAPDAAVLLMPGAIERAAVEELISAELTSSTKKERVTLKDKIKNAAHRESESYTMYGVETKKIFTEEIEIDVMGGAAFTGSADVKATSLTADRDDFSSRCASAAKAFGKLMDSARERFRDFAYKVNHLRLGS